MSKKISKNFNRLKRHKRIRNKIFGTSERPRLSVFKSLSHIYAQIIDDTTGRTLVSFSTLDKRYNKKENISSMNEAEIVGTKIAELAKEKKISRVVFDRSGYIYHGKIKTLAEAARKAGLEF